MNSTLSFEYRYSDDGDDFGSLTAKVKTPDFSGTNAMWVQWQDLTEFAGSLSNFPIKGDSPVGCDWGFGEDGKYTPITLVKIAPAGKTGALMADVYLADYYDPNNRCQTIFETDYPSLERFQEEIHRMMHDRCGVASLEGMKN